MAVGLQGVGLIDIADVESDTTPTSTNEVISQETGGGEYKKSTLAQAVNAIGIDSVTLADTTDTTTFVVLAGAATGDEALLTDASGMAYDANTGTLTMPNHPCFLVKPAGTLLNVTGNATLYTIIWSSEIFDQGANFNTGTGTFTAPVTGRYRFSTNIYPANFVDSTITTIVLVTSKRSVTLNHSGYSTFTETEAVYSGSILLDMDASDTATVTIKVTGESGGDIVDLISASYFSGELVV